MSVTLAELVAWARHWSRRPPAAVVARDTARALGVEYPDVEASPPQPDPDANEWERW